MDKVERVQYQAALAVTGAWRGSSRLKLYEELGWESLSDRRWCRRMLHLHKILDNKTPCYLKDKLADPCTFKTIVSPFMKKDAGLRGIKAAFSLTQPTLGIKLSHISMIIFQLLAASKIIYYPLFDQWQKVFSVYMIP